MAQAINSKSTNSFEARNYQIELINHIKKINAILYLPTGSGKTYIALEIIKHMAKDLAKPISEGGKRTIFLVNQVHLVEQHYSYLMTHCSLKITKLTGDTKVDRWKANEWRDIENNNQVLVMTTQIYVNVLTHAYMHLKNANLIVFDECHHAVKNHPMSQVMAFFDNCDEKDHPKVLGLSATLLNANTTDSQLPDKLETLENTFRSKIITSSRVSEVKKFSTKAKEAIQQCSSYTPPVELRTRIDDLMKKYINIIENLKLKEPIEFPEEAAKLINDSGQKGVSLLKNCLSDLMVHLDEFGVYFCYIDCKLYINQLYIMIKNNNKKLYCNVLLMMINLLKAIKEILYLEIIQHGDIDNIEVVKNTSAIKLKYLLDQLKERTVNDKCIVFVERRMTAKILSKIIEMAFKKEKKKLSVDFMIGESGHPLRKSREDDCTKKSNKKVMNNFRAGNINILVASNVLEEGIDMPDCNVVFMYDFPKTYRSYVQSKGRARKEDSIYVLLSNKKEEEDNLYDFRKLENKFENLVDSYDISKDEDNEDRLDTSEETYITAANASITKTQSIPLIYRYCSSLPHDIFTQMTPYWWEKRTDDGNGCYCKLQLPMNAAIKEIKSPICSNIKEAQQAVAFETVKMLHKMGVLDDNLVPIRAPCQTQDEEYWFPNWVDEQQTGETKFPKREIDMKVPKYLENCRPIANEPCYMHVINIKAQYTKPELRRHEACHRLLTSRYELGILTRREIPKVCDFPVFSEFGEVRVSIDTNHRKLILNEKQLLAVSKFHRVLFLKAIQVVKKFLSYSEDSNAIGYFIVPLKPSDQKAMMEIDYDVVSHRWDIFDAKEPSEEERLELAFTKENYYGFVLSKWYEKVDKTVNRKYFIVTDVSETCNLQSPFPNRKYKSYAEFLKKRHNLDSLRPDQPMMEARPISQNLDCLRPRATSTDKAAKKSKNECKLAAEFCMKQTFPAVYWYKATVLPTILHRLHYLLLAEEIREKIVVEGGIGSLDWEKEDDDVLPVNKKYEITKPKDDKNPMPKEVKRSTRPTIYIRSSPDFENPPELMTLGENSNYTGPRQKEIFEALIPKKCNDIVDMERLETLGDSFLKFAVSITIFVKHNTVNEGYLTTLKNRLVENRNLFYCGNKLELGSFIKENTFSPHNNWCPPGFALPELKEIPNEISSLSSCFIFHVAIPFMEQFSGTLSRDTIANIVDDVNKFMGNASNIAAPQGKVREALSFFNKQVVRDKTVADAMEALIGVYVKTGGIKPAYKLLNYFGILANPTYEEVMGTQVPSPRLKTSELTVGDLVPNYQALEGLLHYEFRDKSYIVQALSHASCLKNNMTDCYQTLEFIGDAVIDFLITSYIYQYSGNLDPGELTDLRSSLVNNNTFGALCVRLGFDKFLLSNNKNLTDAINGFIDYQKQRNHEIYGNEMMIVKWEGDVKVAEEVYVPKVLGDLFESIAGAIYLDSGNNLKTVWRVYYNIMKKEIKKFSGNIPKNPVKAMHEEANRSDRSVNFSKETSSPNENEKLTKFIEGKTEVRLEVTKKGTKDPAIYIGRGENRDLCERAAAKLALRDFGRTEFFI